MANKCAAAVPDECAAAVVATAVGAAVWHLTLLLLQPQQAWLPFLCS